MKSKRLHRIMALVIATLTVVVSLFWIGQAVSDERAIMVYKNPT